MNIKGKTRMDATIDHGSLQTHRVKTSKDWISTCDFELALESHYHLVEGEGGKNTIIFIFLFSIRPVNASFSYFLSHLFQWKLMKSSI